MKRQSPSRWLAAQGRYVIESLESRLLLADVSHLLFTTLDGRMGEMNITAAGGAPAGMAYNVQPLGGVAAPIDVVRFPNGPYVTALQPQGQQPATELLVLNPINGNLEFYFEFGGRPLDVTEGDMAYNPATNRIWLSQAFTNGQLTLLDVLANESRTLTSSTFMPTEINGLEFVPASLFGLSGDYVLLGLGGATGRTDTAFLIDTTTGEISNPVPLSRPLGSTAGFVRDPATGDCYVADGGEGGTDSLYRLNPVTGALTRLGAMNLPGGASGLALGEADDTEPFIRRATRLSAVPDLVYGAPPGIGSIDFPGDTDFLLHSSLVVEPYGSPSFLQPKLEFLDAQGRVVTSAVAPAVGAPVYLSLAPDVDLAQKLRIRVSDASDSGLVSLYRVTPTANASVEAEAPDGTVNDTLATAQNIDISAIPLDAQGQSSRLAVRGLLAADPAAQDWYAFTVDAGEPISIGLEQNPAPYADNQDLTQVLKLDLFDASGNVLASGFHPGDGRLAFEQVIRRFVADAPTTLYARVTKDPAAITPAGKTYHLAVVRNADLEVETTDGDTTPQPLELRPGFGARVLGDLRFVTNRPDTDDYAVQLKAGQKIEIEVVRPPIPTVAVEFTTVPEVRLVNSDGVVVATGKYQGNSRFTLTHTPTASGLYRIQLVGAATVGGEYVLSVAPAVIPPAVYARRIFYNDSSFDGADPAATAADDAAIALGKAVLPPGVKANASHYSSYVKGINGVMIDLGTLGANTILTADDFTFRSGRGAPPTFADGPTPQSVAIRRGAGTGGGDRVTLIWSDEQAVKNGWLQVTTKANERTGLTTADTFYFGNLVGDTADSDSVAAVNASDLVAVRNAIGTGAAGVASRFDFNRDGKIDASDLVIVRNSVGRTLPLFMTSGGLFAERRLEDEPPIV